MSCCKIFKFNSSFFYIKYYFIINSSLNSFTLFLLTGTLNFKSAIFKTYVLLNQVKHH